MDNRTVADGKQVIAHVYSKHLSTNGKGVAFLTPDEYTLQLGLIEHPKGKIVRNHIHRQDIKYRVDTTQEFLYIEKGQVLVKLFSDKWDLLETVKLTAGDFVLFVSGGHGLEITKDCRIIEIKQGPYPGEGNVKIFQEDDMKSAKKK